MSISREDPKVECRQKSYNYMIVRIACAFLNDPMPILSGDASIYMSGVGLIAGVVSLGSYGPEFKSWWSIELIPGGVDSACHPFEVSKISTSLLVSCVRVVTCPGL